MAKTVGNQHRSTKFIVCWGHFWDGVASVLEIMPPPPSRNYRPHFRRKDFGSLQDDRRNLYSDRMKVRKDFQKAVQSMKQEKLAK